MYQLSLTILMLLINQPKTSGVYNDKCLLLTFLESDGDHVGRSNAFGWAYSYVWGLASCQLIYAGLTWLCSVHLSSSWDQ